MLLAQKDLGHLTETHHAATQVLLSCQGGLQPREKLRQSVLLMNVPASARFESSSHHFGIGVSGEKYDLAIRANLSDLTGSFDATQFRKANVQKNQIRLQFSHFLKRFQSIRCKASDVQIGVSLEMFLNAVSPKSEIINNKQANQCHSYFLTYGSSSRAVWGRARSSY